MTLRIRCCAANAGELPKSYLRPGVNLTATSEFPLTVGHEYLVLAVWFRAEQVWYLIFNDDGHVYPMSYPAPLFEQTSDGVPADWKLRLTPGHLDHSAIISFHEWANDGYFYDRLTDSDPDAIARICVERAKLESTDERS